MNIPKGLLLENQHVRLEPLGFCHAADLFAAGSDAALWVDAFRGHQMPSMDATMHYIAEALHGNIKSPGGIPFAIIEKVSRKAIGCTRYFDISYDDLRLEIGWTWLARRYWRTFVNTNCKFLLLKFAFEDAGFNRVQLRADAENHRSRAAIARIGATFEGTLREVRSFGDSKRSISCYSVIASEWPAVKARLSTRLSR